MCVPSDLLQSVFKVSSIAALHDFIAAPTSFRSNRSSFTNDSRNQPEIAVTTTLLGGDRNSLRKGRTADEDVDVLLELLLGSGLTMLLPFGVWFEACPNVSSIIKSSMEAGGRALG